MTTVNVSPQRANVIATACRELGIPAPAVTGIGPSDPQVTLTWTPDLSAQDQATLTRIQQLAVGSTLITPAELAAIQPDIDGLITFAGIATPTLAQTVSAVKAQSRILKAVLRS